MAQKQVSGNVTSQGFDVNASAHTKSGTGVAGSLQHQFGVGGPASVTAQVGAIDGNHQATAWAQHQRHLDKNFRPVGPETNSAGINYTNLNSGAGAFLSGSKTHGYPAVGTAGVNVPVVSANQGNTNLSVVGQSSFARHSRPNHFVGARFEHKF